MKNNKNNKKILEDHAQDLKKFTEDILSFFEINTSVDLNLTSDYSTKLGEERHSALIKIDVPETNRLLIGKNAKNLYSLQSIIAAYSRKNLLALDLIIQLDIGGYRESEQKRFLEELELKIQEVLKSAECLELSGLNSLERRLAHNYVSEKYGGKLNTKSTGIGHERKLIITVA
jgi:predicted RNA-binding protein Jag